MAEHPTKKDIVDKLVKDFDIYRPCAMEVMKVLPQAICELLIENEKVALTGLGVFKKANMGRKTVRNPHTGESMEKDNVMRITCKLSNAFKNHVRGKE